MEVGLHLVIDIGWELEKIYAINTCSSEIKCNYLNIQLFLYYLTISWTVANGNTLASLVRANKRDGFNFA